MKSVDLWENKMVDLYNELVMYDKDLASHYWDEITAISRDYNESIFKYYNDDITHYDMHKCSKETYKKYKLLSKRIKNDLRDIKKKILKNTKQKKNRLCHYQHNYKS